MIKSFSILVFLCLYAFVSAQTKELESRLKSLQQKYAQEYYNLGKLMYEKKVYELSYLAFQKAIESDPNFFMAREKLGFKKAGAEWVKNEKYVVYQENKASARVIVDMTSKYKQKKLEIEKKQAKEYFELGIWCEKNGLEENAKKMFQRVLHCDAEHEKAREKLGYKKINGLWATVEEQEKAKQWEEMKKNLPGGEPVQGNSAEERTLGFSLNKRKSDRFFLFTHLEQKEAEEVIRWAELTRVAFHQIFEIPMDRELVSQPIRIFLLKDHYSHEMFVDRFSVEKEHKEEIKKMAGDISLNPVYTECWQGDRDIGYLKDDVVHTLAHIYFSSYIPANIPNWLYEAIGYYFSVKLLGTQITQCTSFDTGANDKNMNSQNGPLLWRSILKKAVADGTDAPIYPLMGTNLASLSYEEAIKGWSIFDFLLTEHKKRFFDFLHKLRDGKDQEENMKQSLGWNMEQLDEAWKQYVRKNY